jgi:heme/copper-type cytochrome/quinol oxidase subunit 3
MNAAITSVYAVIAPCTPVTVVSRSATICEIETFITLESSTITNCAAARMTRGNQRRIKRPYLASVAQVTARTLNGKEGSTVRVRQRLT